MSVPIAKYRPNFTLDQLKLIESKLTLDTTDTTEHQLKLYLITYIFKIDTGFMSGAYLKENKSKIADKLGFDVNAENLSIEQKRELAIKKYNSFPDLCSKFELEQVYNYKLVHQSFASEQEEADLEAIVFGTL